MFGGPSKLGRGGGAKRFPGISQPNRSSVTPAGRLSLSGPRNRNPGPPAAPPAVEETFSLVSGNNPLAFAMIIRLAPDLVEEIRRVEGQGGAARIKFDANPNNPSGNVIDVGGKEFRFTWSKEFGDLCDIYEERQNGEDGNGLLVESGCAWRKLNVQRVLDESTTNQVKMRSEEAERKKEQRKAIILDHGNPSMKSQIKQLAAVEATPWKMAFKKKEPPPKKRKVEPTPVSAGGPPKAAFKSGVTSSSKPTGRVARSASPLPSPPDPFHASASPSGTLNVSRANASTEDISHTQLRKEDATISERATPTKASGPLQDRSGFKVNLGSKPIDLQSMLASLLKENPKGMSLKALEKAIGDTFPNSGKKIEPILKRIAIYQAPGRYLLKQGQDLESTKGPSPGSASSFEDNHHQIPASEGNSYPASEPAHTFREEVHPDEGLAQANIGELDGSENVDIEQHSPDILGDKKDSANSEGQTDSSSDSGSDSDSDSGSSDSRSDSGSPSGSRSRSKSPVKSGSGSSSDDESDASSNKEASDEDVDIMTSDDDKGPKTIVRDSEPPFPPSPPIQNGIDEKHDGNDSDIVDIDGDVNNEDQDVVERAFYLDKEHGGPAGGSQSISPNHSDLQERQKIIGSLFDEAENMCDDSFKREQVEGSDRTSRGKSKRGSDSKNSNVKPERVKRSKTENLDHPPVPAGGDFHYSLSPHEVTPDKLNEDPYRSPGYKMLNKADRDANTDYNAQRGSQSFPGKSNSYHQPQAIHRSYDQGSQPTSYDMSGRTNRHAESSNQGLRSSETSLDQALAMQKDRSVRGTPESSGVERVSRPDREGGIGSKHSRPSDLHYNRHGETVGNLKDARQNADLNMGPSSKDSGRSGAERTAPINGRGAMLQREFSDLELGELREPLPEEAPMKKQLERKGSFNQTENRSNLPDTRNVDPVRGKPPGKSSLDVGKPSTPNPTARIPGNSEGFSRKRTQEHRDDDVPMPVQRGKQLLPQPSAKADSGNGTLPLNKTADAVKSRKNGIIMTQGIISEKNGAQQPDMKRRTVSQPTTRDSKQQATMANIANGQKDTISAEYCAQKRRESSSDENSCSYSKYEKDEPELKGRIKDFSQYNEYVQEYRDKYDSYCSLNKVLESYRDEFQKMGKDLEVARGRDVERSNNIMAQIKESYQKCSTKHRRLKKIFMVLHEELQHLKQMIKDFANAYAKD